MPHIPICQIARHLGVVSDSELLVSGYQIDSRCIQPGELFFALKGEKSDGHAFLGEVKERGGVAAVVSKGYAGSDWGLLLIAVEDPLFALQELARHSLKGGQLQIVGITCSVCKT